MVGLNGTRVIHPSWEAHHRPVAVSSMNAWADIVLPGEPGGYPDFIDEPGTVLSGRVPVRVQSLKRAGRADAQGELVDTGDVLVTLPVDRWPDDTQVTDQGPHVVVTAYQDGYAGDPDLIGRRLRIQRMDHSSYLWERDLYCVLDHSEAR